MERTIPQLLNHLSQALTENRYTKSIKRCHSCENRVRHVFYQKHDANAENLAPEGRLLIIINTILYFAWCSIVFFIVFILFCMRKRITNTNNNSKLN